MLVLKLLGKGLAKDLDEGKVQKKMRLVNTFFKKKAQRHYLPLRFRCKTIKFRIQSSFKDE